MGFGETLKLEMHTERALWRIAPAKNHLALEVWQTGLKESRANGGKISISRRFFVTMVHMVCVQG